MAETLPILVVEDDPGVRRAMVGLLRSRGMHTLEADRPEDALAQLRSAQVGVVIMDMNFQAGGTAGEEGVALFRAVRALDAELPVVLMTAWTSLEAAVQLVREGASDYVAKPWDADKVVASMRNLLELRALRLENQRLRDGEAAGDVDLARTADLRGMVFKSAAMRRVLTVALHVAPSEAPILITGPNGSGKERLADVIHANSARRAGPCVKVNAGALPDDLIEAELFGAEAGAFTGATKLRLGRFEAANGGTLLLDEIGTMSMHAQTRLLRALETREFQRLGSSQTRVADVRVVAATNADLKQAIRDGRFREDLYFRLNVIELRVPPLRERTEDVLPLAYAFLKNAGSSLSISPAGAEAMLRHDWAGNVRELHNRMQRAVLLCQGTVVGPEDLGLELVSAAGLPAGPLVAAQPQQPRATPAPVRPTSQDGEGPTLERRVVAQALEQANGVVAHAAQSLGLSRQALYRQMKKLGVDVERKTRAD